MTYYARAHNRGFGAFGGTQAEYDAYQSAVAQWAEYDRRKAAFDAQQAAWAEYFKRKAAWDAMQSQWKTYFAAKAAHEANVAVWEAELKRRTAEVAALRKNNLTWATQYKVALPAPGDSICLTAADQVALARTAVRGVDGFPQGWLAANAQLAARLAKCPSYASGGTLATNMGPRPTANLVMPPGYAGNPPPPMPAGYAGNPAPTPPNVPRPSGVVAPPVQPVVPALPPSAPPSLPGTPPTPETPTVIAPPSVVVDRWQPPVVTRPPQPLTPSPQSPERPQLVMVEERLVDPGKPQIEPPPEKPPSAWSTSGLWLLLVLAGGGVAYYTLAGKKTKRR